MKSRTSLCALCSLACWLIWQPVAHAVDTDRLAGIRGALLAADEVTQARIEQLVADNCTAAVIILAGSTAEIREQEQRAAELVAQSVLSLYYWVEVARCPELADAHPDWMASLQGHGEWRRFFPDAPKPSSDEVVKTYPWVPILSRETFDAQLRRVRQLLGGRRSPEGVFLNDLQGAPSACGCGHPLCRWTSDYGERRTTTALGSEAAAQFVKAVQKSMPDSKVLPVWTTECEQHDGAQTGLCAGVGCFKGICWEAFAEQLGPLEEQNSTLSVLLPFREFSRDLPRYGESAGWIREAIELFSTMYVKHGGRPIPASRLIAVLQGWEVNTAEIEQQIRVATAAGATGYVVAYSKIEQSWQPKLVRWR